MNMSSMSIIPQSELQANPVNLPYHNPRFPIVRYSKMVVNYFFWKQVQLAEELARMMGCILVPSSILNWRRKKLFADKCIVIGSRSFYTIKLEELTKKETEKLYDYLNDLKA